MQSYPIIVIASGIISIISSFFLIQSFPEGPVHVTQSKWHPMKDNWTIIINLLRQFELEDVKYPSKQLHFPF